MAKTVEGIEMTDFISNDGIKSAADYRHSTVNARVAQLILNTRIQTGLSQRKLAQMIDTTQSVISRLENASYKGHSLSMLSRIAQAMEYEVRIDFVHTKTSQTK